MMAGKDDSDDKELQKVKAEIRSLLISFPSKSVPLNSFLKDFQQNIGKPLPFKNFNFNTPLQFLCSLSDVVQVIDGTDGARLAPLTNDLSSHISQMVGQQKKNSSRRRFRRSPPPRHRSYASPNIYGPPPQPLMGSDTRGHHAYHYPTPLVPIIPPLLPPHVENFFHHSAYPTYGFAGNPSAYSFSTGAQQFPSVHPASVPYTSLRGPYSSPSNVEISRVENIKPSNDQVIPRLSPLRSVVSEENAYKRLDKSISFNINGPEGENSFQVSPNQTYNTSNADGTPKTENWSFTVHNSFVDSADSKINNVDDHASVDILSGPENQRSSPKSISEKSKCSNDDNSDFKSKMWDVLEKHTNGVSSSVFKDLYESLHSCSLDLAPLGYSSLKEMVLKNEDVFSFEKHKSSDDWILYDARLKPRKRHIQDERKQWIPHSVVDNLAVLALKHPNGIDADEILSHYKAEFSTDVDPKMLGFDDLYSFLESCKSICLKKCNEKGVVYPKDWVSKSHKTTPPAEMSEPALPPVEEMKLVWRDFFKENECNPTFKYSDPFIPEEKLFKVKVVDLHSPALMWIHYVDDVKSLNNMMCQMNIHYDREHQDYCIPENFIMPGLAVASMFAGKWHRALVLSVNGELAEVLYVDYGTHCVVNTSELRKLDRRFGQDRLHAIKASLFCLVPYNGDEWSVESCEFLYAHYAEKIIFAEICSVNYQDSFVEVIFYDTSKGVDININDLLVSEKLARYVTNPSTEDKLDENLTLYCLPDSHPLSNSTLTKMTWDHASILNERSIAKLYKFFPRWFSISDRSDNDMSMCCKNVLLSTAADSIPVNSDVIPCCKSHCIQALYQANSEAMSLIWEKSVKQEEERIVNNVIRQVEDTLKEWGWDSCITSEVCCVDNVRHTETYAQALRGSLPKSRSSSITGFNHGLNHTETSAQPVREPQPQENGFSELRYLPKSRSSSVTGFNQGLNHAETSAQPVREPQPQENGFSKLCYLLKSGSSSVTGFNQGLNHTETSAQPVREPQPQENGFSKLCYLPKSRSSSVTGFNPARWIVNRRNNDRTRIRPYPRTVRYVDAEFRGKLLTLISFKGEIRVSLSQLFQLTKLPSMLARKRLEISQVEADLVLVTLDNYPDLYHDLCQLKLNTPDGELFLVLLSDAPKIVRAIDPLGGYKDTFENLAKEVAPYLEKLNCQNTSAPS